jgi:hypothetical protein
MEDLRYDHDITLLIAIYLMLDLAIIECYVFCFLQLDQNVDAFMQNNYICQSLLLNQMHTP